MCWKDVIPTWRPRSNCWRANTRRHHKEARVAILIDETKRVIVQGITGREGQARTRLMLDYGTKVVGGVTPGKGGTEVLGVPVFSTCAEAVAALGGVDISVLFV